MSVHSAVSDQANFISEDEINQLLNDRKDASQLEVREVINKARHAKGLSPQEVAILLQTDDITLIQQMFSAACELKEKIYGKRVVLFAPLYLSDHCINSCVYCGYRRENDFPRHRLTQTELASEVKALEAMGHKRLALEAGEHPIECTLEYVLECLHTIYNLKFDRGSIRRCNINIAATGQKEYQLLKNAGIGTYILFQETYQRETYHKMHPRGPKSDYDWHTTAHDRAMQAGIDDVGLGVLFGLYDYKFEVLALIMHALHLEQRFGVGPHTISVPRLRRATGVNLEAFPFLVSDMDFMKIVAVIRLAVPYTGIILSTREGPNLRDRLISQGVSQISVGSCTGVGSYSRRSDVNKESGKLTQFSVEDHRDPDEVLLSLCKSGWLPSYCTACYRQGRTGDRFMSLAKSGEIQSVCEPNALLTFKEYLLDYASPEIQTIGERKIQRHLSEIKNGHMRRFVEQGLESIESGQRDIFL